MYFIALNDGRNGKYAMQWVSRAWGRGLIDRVMGFPIRLFGL